MAGSDSQQRTERATPKRLEEARRRGQVPRSVDLSAAAVVATTAGALLALGTTLGGELQGLMKAGLTIGREQALDAQHLLPALAASLSHTLLAVLPLLALTLCAALAAPLVLGGWNFSAQALSPDFGRLSPAAGLARMFSARGPIELSKALAKFALVACVAVLFLWQNSARLLALGEAPVAAAVADALSLSGRALLMLACGLLVVAAVDVPLQLWQHARQLRMTREEVREELKQSEGSPEIKGRIRAVQQAMARGRMMHDVPKADVVVTNPTHYAVALRYDEKRMRAPVVVAKGTDLVAARIREIAFEHAVPVLEAPPLARALHRSVDIGAEIPAALYVAVAQVLTWVHQLRAARSTGAPLPPPPHLDAAPGVQEH